MTDLFYAVVKASLHANDASVFGLKNEEIQALLSRYPGSSKNVVNGVLVKANPLQVINSLGELGYRVVCSSGESDIVWTLKREGLVDPDYYPGKETQIAREIIEKAKSSSPVKRVSYSGPPVAGLSSVSSELNEMNIQRKNKPEISADGSQQLIIDDPSQQIVDESQQIITSETSQVEEKKEKVYKMGAKPEDFAEYLPDTSSRIYIRNPESFDQGSTEPEMIRVILRTNECSANNPLARTIPSTTGISGVNTGLSIEPSTCPCPTPLPLVVRSQPSKTGVVKPIWYNAMMGEASAVKDLLIRGCNVNESDPSGYTALHYAAKNGNTEICKLLIFGGALVNLQTQAGLATALHRAAGAGKIDVCKLLLSSGAQTLIRDVDGRTPLHRAVEGGHEAATTLLLEHSLEALTIRDNRGYTPFDLAKDESLRALITRIVKPSINITPQKPTANSIPQKPTANSTNKNHKFR